MLSKAELKTIEKTLRTAKAFCIPIADNLPTAIHALELRHQPTPDKPNA